VKNTKEQSIRTIEEMQAYLDQEEKGQLWKMEEIGGVSVFLQSALRTLESSQRRLGLTSGWNGKEE
jgi:hypothetical protein